MGMKIDDLPSPLLFITYNLITRLIISVDETLTQKSKLLQFLRRLFIYVFYIVSHVLLSFPLPIRFPFDTTKSSKQDIFNAYDLQNNPCINDKQLNSTSSNNGHVSLTDTAIARAIKQLLTLVSIIPVSSRKYEVVRCLVEKLIDENLKEGVEVLREVNCVVLNDAFGKTLIGLESKLMGQENGFGPGGFGLGRVFHMVKGWGGPKDSGGPDLRVDTVFAEKAAAELLWLAQKLVASGGAMGAVEKWGSASDLGWLGLSAEPRVQSSLVKLTVFLVNQANELNKHQHQQTDSVEMIKQKQTLLKMLLTWIPLLCQANHGTDAPTLSISEREEVETSLEEIIDTLPEDEDCQEKVLSLWLHHFAKSPSSDWPNLYNSYIRWCTVSRNLLVTR